ncbi:MerR family transcriptional regulator [Ktedonosporobacter rubrisoli]|uniref:MerR family transcriptional regulator n=1 Tax=Ktedonosporobacter rubrisoli TaxID=2509675 RepID=A0A4P6JNV9_KTERU|nr:MerR family transcriptional regulator [Ktedonosporobacter rubrisoli]QBD76762.1 MerR family transcriptional regulator [Ktedonosporobacter rubrisoli]
MMLHNALRTIDLARAAGISVQQVRNYEASGLLPPASRSKSGYRLYTQRHLAALTTARNMLAGYGWQRTPGIMNALHQGDLSAALTTIDQRHAELANKRHECEQTLAALHMLATQSTPAPSLRHPQALRVGEAARQVGVRVSALHFWEQQGLLQPKRDRSSRYRLYDEEQMSRLRVVALLREAGYPFKVIQAVLDEMAAGRPAKAIVAVEKRREELMRSSWACVESLVSFQGYVKEFCAPLL